MIAFLSALQFLTIVPIRLKSVSEKNLVRSLTYFPVIGFLISAVLFVVLKLFSILGFGYIAQDTVVVVLLIIITGGLHLDGLADTFDAMLSRKNKDQMLLIMRDSHIGAMGVLGLISIIFLKIVFLFSVNFSLMLVPLALMCVLSRYSMVLSMFLFPYARPEGKARVYIEGITGKILLIATIITLLAVFLFWQFKGLLVMVIVCIFSYIFSNRMTNKIGGITGDTLGALCEINELVVLFSIVLIRRLFHG